jgi:potassium/sodium efflux P-type ATPase
MTQQQITQPWHALEGAQALTALEANADGGLSAAEVTRRRALYGENTLPKAKPDSVWALLWRQLNNPLLWVLNASAVVAMLIEPVEGLKNGAVILAVVLLNTLIGFVQELRAGKAIEALSTMVPELVSVCRDGRAQQVEALSLVPGDIVTLASGDRVPADLRLLEASGLQIEEAALTGESVPSVKTTQPVDADAMLGDRLCLAFNGTLVTSGTATALVVATGAATELGRISTLIHQATDLQTPLTKALESISRYLTVAIAAVAALVLVAGTWRAVIETHQSVWMSLRETVIFAIALAVGAIPEGLPAIVTIALAIGVQRMAKRRAVIRKLPAVETLGSTTVICSDKTGTLTRNEMTVQSLWTAPDDATYHVEGSGYSPEGRLLSADRQPLDTPPTPALDLALAATLCNDSTLSLTDGQWTFTGDPTEAALVVLAHKLGLPADAARDKSPRLHVIPFESERQLMATLHAPARILLKGAPEVIASRCTASDADTLALMLQRVTAFAAEGMRVLAFASRDLDSPKSDPDSPSDPDAHSALTDEAIAAGFTLLGLQAMIDPPREEALHAVAACHAAGIIVKMITGDHPATAQAIASQFKLTSPDTPCVTGQQLAKLPPDQWPQTASDSNVFARVAPEHKLQLVQALQSLGHVVAMTGDGVNDSPALKQANIGVAMGLGGTAAARDAADIVLTDDNFASITAAVEEGRRVYDNLVKSLAFVMPTNMGLALILICAVAFFGFYDTLDGRRELLLPMHPTQLLWINLVATVALALPLAFEAREPDIMSRPPRRPDAPIFDAFILWRTFTVTALMTAGAVGLFLFAYYRDLDAGLPNALSIANAQTMAVSTVITFQIFYMLNCRSLHASVFAVGFFSNPTIWIGIGSLVTLQATFIYMPWMQRVFSSSALSLSDLAISMLFGAIILPVIGFEKWRYQRTHAAKPTTAPAP